MDTITKEKLKRERQNEKDDEKTIRAENKAEIDKLWDKKKEGVSAFLKFCQEHYKNWKN